MTEIVNQRLAMTPNIGNSLITGAYGQYPYPKNSVKTRIFIGNTKQFALTNIYYKFSRFENRPSFQHVIV